MGRPFGGPAPYVPILIFQFDLIAVAVPGDASLGFFIFQMEVAAGYGSALSLMVKNHVANAIMLSKVPVFR